MLISFAVNTDRNEVLFITSFTFVGFMFSSTLSARWFYSLALVLVVMEALTLITSLNIEMIINRATIHTKVYLVVIVINSMSNITTHSHGCMVVISKLLLSYSKNREGSTFIDKLSDISVEGKNSFL